MSDQARKMASWIARQFEGLHVLLPNGTIKSYPDPYSPLGRYLRQNKLWAKFLAGRVELDELGPAGRLSGAPWTIGYGHTRGVTADTRATRAQCHAWLDEDLQDAVECVERSVKVPLTAGQKAALIDFVYNIGPGRKATPSDHGKDGFCTLKSGHPSSLLRLLNARDYSGACAQLKFWVGAQGSASEGLRRRREMDRKVFSGELRLEDMK